MSMPFEKTLAEKYPASTTSFVDFVSVMEEVGYAAMQPSAIATVQNALSDMETGPEYEDNIVAVGCDGAPGTGKSYIARCIARYLGAEFLMYSCHPDSTQDELFKEINPGAMAESLDGIRGLIARMIDSGQAEILPAGEVPRKASNKTISKRDLYNIGPVLEGFLLSKKKKVVVLFDEIDKGRYAVDATLLSTIQEGEIYVSGWGEKGEILVVRANRRNLIMFVTKNQVRDMENALYRRLYMIWMGYPEAWFERRLLRKELGLEGREFSKMVVTLANKIRRASAVDKAPSFDELRRLGRTMKTLAERDCLIEDYKDDNEQPHKRWRCVQSKETLFETGLFGLSPKQSDHRAVLKALGMMQEKQSTGTTPKAGGIKIRKFLGTALLKAMLRDLGQPDYPLRCISKQQEQQQDKRKTETPGGDTSSA